jgi:hypothetical protein
VPRNGKALLAVSQRLWLIPAPYRQRAALARRLARASSQEDVREMFEQTARDFEELADDLACDAGEVRHAEMLSEEDKV